MRVWSLLLTIVLLAGCSSARPNKLYLFTWSELFSPELIAEFEETYNCDVHFSIYDSNESMYAKLKLGATGYDLIFPSSYFMQLLTDQKIIQPLDPARLPSLKDLDPDVFHANQRPVMGVPFLVGFTGIAYRADRIPPFTPSWGIFSDSRYRGRMTLLNDMRDALSAALLYRGYSVNSRIPAQVEAAADQLIAWKQNLAKFESEQYKNGIASREFLIVQAHSIDVTQVQQEDPDVHFVVPKEGTALSIDYIALLSDARHADLAYDFINFMLEPKRAARNMAYIQARIPVKTAYPLLDKSQRENPLLFPSEAERKKMELIEDVQEDIVLYYRAWDRVKAS